MATLSQVLISLNSSGSQLDFKLHADVDTDEQLAVLPSSAEDSERISRSLGPQ